MRLRLVLLLLGATLLGRPAAAASVGSIQRGSLILTDGSLLGTATLSQTVDVSKSMLIFGIAESTNMPINGQVSGQITAPSTVRFERNGTLGDIAIHWQVVEFATGVVVQRGTASLSPGPPVVVTLPGSVDPTRSFPIVTLRTDGDNFAGDDFVRAELTGSTSLELSSSSFGANAFMEWQVIDYSDALVQTGTLNFSSGDASQPAILGAFDPTKSWLVYSYALGGPGSPNNIGEKLFRGTITNGTTLTFDRNNTGVNAELTWYLVEFNDATTVRHGSEVFTTPETQRSVTLAPAVTSKASIAVAGGDYQRGGRSPYSANDNAGVAWFTSEVLGDTTLQLTRNATFDAAEVGWFVIDFGLEPVQVLAATSTSGRALLQWVNPEHGLYSKTKILRSQLPGCPAGPNDLSATTVVTSGAGGPGGRESWPDNGVTDGNTYCYKAWVDADGTDTTFSTDVKVEARPFDTSGAVKWAYSTRALTMSAPGVRIPGVGPSTIYAVSNDELLHAMNGGDFGGDWPAGWKPYRIESVSQHRPPVLPASVATVPAGVFLASQDGRLHAVDADTGTRLWRWSVASELQAAPAGHFTFDTWFPSSTDLVLIGTRNTATGENALIAREKDTGNPRWIFDYGGGANAIGMISGMAGVDYNLTLPLEPKVYFTSRDHLTGSKDNVWCLKFDGAAPNYDWSTDLPSDVDGPPVLYGGLVYVADTTGAIYALDSGSGAILWGPEPTTNGKVKSFVFPRYLTNQLLYSTDDTVWSKLDSGSGLDPHWDSATLALGILNPSAPLVIPGTNAVIVGSGDGRLYQLDLDDGSVTGSVVLGDPVVMSGLGDLAFDVATEMILVGSEAGIVYAVDFPIP